MITRRQDPRFITRMGSVCRRGARSSFQRTSDVFGNDDVAPFMLSLSRTNDPLRIGRPGPWVATSSAGVALMSVNSAILFGCEGQFSGLSTCSVGKMTDSSNLRSLLVCLSLMSTAAPVGADMMIDPSSADVPFKATFSQVEVIGSSNYTHFWMPTPLVRTSNTSGTTTDHTSV
jgi:hypothetical protein